MEYQVLVAFMDLKDRNHGYEVGDIYPREGGITTQERIDELSGCENRRKVSLIAKHETKEAASEGGDRSGRSRSGGRTRQKKTALKEGTEDE